MIYAENRKVVEPDKYEGSFAQELGIAEDKWQDNSGKELYQLLVKHVSLEKGTFGDFQFEFWVEGTNSMGNSKIKWEFHNCRFQSFGSVDFSTTDDLTERTFNISLKFDYYEVIFSDLPTLKI